MPTASPYPGDPRAKPPSPDDLGAVPVEVVRRAVETHGDGICITDAELSEPGPSIVYVNQAFTTITGYDRTDIIGETPRILQGPLTDRDVVGGVKAALASGDRFVGETINYRRDGTPFVMSWTIDAANDHGTATHFVAFQRDVTAETQLRQQRRALRRLSAGAVDLFGADAPGPEQALELIRSAVASFLLVGEVMCLARIAGRVVATPGAPKVDMDRHLAIASSAAKTEVLNEGDGRLVVAPFEAAPGAIIIGGLDERHVSLVDLDLLEDIARSADAILRALADLELRRREALAVQRVLLPPTDLVVPGFALASRYVPSSRSTHAGGDWYDAVPTEWGVRVCVGDVVGKGMLAAAGMGLLRAHLRAQLAAGASLAAVMTEADEFCRAESLGATLILVDVWRASGQVAAASAGHPPPIVVDDDGARVIGVEPAPPLGAFSSPGPTPVPTHTRLLPNQALVLYTDAAIDDRISDSDGISNLAFHLGDVGPDVASCTAAVVALIDGSRADDLAVLAVALD